MVTCRRLVSEDVGPGLAPAWDSTCRRLVPMWKVLKFLRTTREVLVTAGAVLAAAIVVVETYQALRKKIDAAR